MGNTTSKVTQQDKAILQVKLQRDKLNKYQKTIHYNMNQQRLQIKDFIRAKDKKSAKMVLKRIKYQELLIDKMNDQIMNLENMIRTIEYKLVEKEFLKSLETGNSILKKLNNEVSVENVERLMDDVAENIAYQKEIEDVLSGGLVYRDYNDEIDEELEELEKQEMLKQGGGKEKVDDDKVDKFPSIVGLPDVKNNDETVNDIVEESGERNKKKQENDRTALLA